MSARFANVEGNAFGIEVHSGGLAELALSGASISNNGTGVKVLLDEDENEVKATIDIFSSLIGNNNGHGFEGGGTVVIRSSTIFSMGNLV